MVPTVPPRACPGCAEERRWDTSQPAPFANAGTVLPVVCPHCGGGMYQCLLCAATIVVPRRRGPLPTCLSCERDPARMFIPTDVRRHPATLLADAAAQLAERRYQRLAPLFAHIAAVERRDTALRLLNIRLRLSV